MSKSKINKNEKSWMVSPEETPALMSWYDLPQQRLNEVTELPERPDGFTGQHVFLKAFSDEPKRAPRKTIFLGTAEWTWSPMHNRIDNYYVSKNRRYWFLWSHFYNQYDPPFKWEWHLYAAALKQTRKRIKEFDAAIYLLHDFWKEESVNESIGHYHFIAKTGFLSIEDFQALARLVW